MEEWKKKDESRQAKIKELEGKLSQTNEEKKAEVQKVEISLNDYKKRYDDTKEKFDNQVITNSELNKKVDEGDFEIRKLKKQLGDIEEKKNKQINELTE